MNRVFCENFHEIKRCILFAELRILSFPCNQFAGVMPEGDGDEMLCHLKERNYDLGQILAKVMKITKFNDENFVKFLKFLANDRSIIFIFVIFRIQINVNGDSAIPLYKYLKEKKGGVPLVNNFSL